MSKDNKHAFNHLKILNTHEGMNDKSRLSKSLKISLYRLVSDFTFFTSEKLNENIKIKQNDLSIFVIHKPSQMII